MVPNLQQSLESSQASRPSTFRDKYRFVDIRRIPSALDLAAFACDREFPEIDRLVGNALVDADSYLPVGFAVCYFEPEGAVSVQASFGNLFRTYPKDILAGMAPVCRIVRDSGVKELWAVADEDIEGSTDLIKWMDGERTEHRRDEPPCGWWYRMDLTSERMTKWLVKRG